MERKLHKYLVLIQEEKPIIFENKYKYNDGVGISGMELLFFLYLSITQWIRLAPKYSAYKKELDYTDRKRTTNFDGGKKKSRIYCIYSQAIYEKQ